MKPTDTLGTVFNHGPHAAHTLQAPSSLKKKCRPDPGKDAGRHVVSPANSV